MGQMTRIHRFPWGTADDAQVLIVHFGSKSTPMIAHHGVWRVSAGVARYFCEICHRKL